MFDTNEMEIRLHGIAVSPGICIGKAYLLGKEGVDIVDKYLIGEDDLQNEIKRFKSAVKNASIYKDERFSDHSPLIVDYDFKLT